MLKRIRGLITACRELDVDGTFGEEPAGLRMKMGSLEYRIEFTHTYPVGARGLVVSAHPRMCTAMWRPRIDISK